MSLLDYLSEIQSNKRQCDEEGDNLSLLIFQKIERGFFVIN